MADVTTKRAIDTKRYILPLVAAAGVLGTAFVGALLTTSSTGGLVGGVESLSSSSQNFLTGLTLAAPVGFAFGAGMVSSANPCGFAMLPVYLGLYVGNPDGKSSPGIAGSLVQATIVGGAMTLGFVVLFGLVGMLLSLGAQSLVGAFPWIGLGVGVLLALAGVWLLTGGTLYTAYTERLAGRFGDPRRTSPRGYFVFGVSYGVASLSCTLPIFLAVVGSSVAVSGFASSVAQFLLYALGMGSVILTLTISMALFKGAMVRWLRLALPYIQPASTVFMLLAGAYIVYYWLTIGGLLGQRGSL